MRITLEPVQNLYYLGEKASIFCDSLLTYFYVCCATILETQRFFAQYSEILNRFLIKTLHAVIPRQVTLKGTLVFLLALLTQGCLQPVNLPEIHKYQLTANPLIFKCMPKTSKTLFISLPQANQPYNTTQMVYSEKPHEICWFAQNRWVTPIPQMILPLIVQSIRDTHHFKAVVGFPSVVNTDYRLDTSLIAFKQEFCRQKSRVHIILDATLIFSNTQKIIATRRIEVFVPTSCKTPESGVQAYQCALNKVLKELTSFIIQH